MYFSHDYGPFSILYLAVAKKKCPEPISCSTFALILSLTCLDCLKMSIDTPVLYLY